MNPDILTIRYSLRLLLTQMLALPRHFRQNIVAVTSVGRTFNYSQAITTQFVYVYLPVKAIYALPIQCSSAACVFKV